jgi:hypothetical protein
MCMGRVCVALCKPVPPQHAGHGQTPAAAESRIVRASLKCTEVPAEKTELVSCSR